MSSKVTKNVKKKTKVSKKSRRSVKTEDVPVHTSLPPSVEGQLRCFLKLTVSQIIWLMPNPPDVTSVVVKWWGEDGEGSVFRPVDVKKSDRGAGSRTVARYAIRSGPKQLSAYLTDMSSLILEVVGGTAMTSLGYAQVDQVSVLAPSRPINGFFPVFTVEGDKIAELQVSMMLESLMTSYDSSGSIPTTDMSTELPSNQSIHPTKTVPVPYPSHTIISSAVEDPFASPVQPKTYKVSPKHNEPSRSDIDSLKLCLAGKEKDYRNTEIPTRDTGIEQKTAERGEKGVGKPQSGTDLVSALLDRGKKLQEEMIVSTVKDTLPSSARSLDVTDDVGDMEIPESGRSSKRSVGSTGDLFKEILRDEAKGSRFEDESDESDVERRAVDLVFGANITDTQLHSLKALSGHLDASLSSDENVFSDPGDPAHDETILHELFYKNPQSDSDSISGVSSDEEEKPSRRITSRASISSLEDPGNRRPPSRQSSRSTPASSHSRKRPSKKSRPPVKARQHSGQVTSGSEWSDNDHLSVSRGSDGSRVSFDMTPSDAEEQSALSRATPDVPVDGLSIDRLTLLGRVHVARVVVEALRLNQETLPSTPQRGKGKTKAKGRPPKPSPKAKKPSTYFVEYQFPVVATSRDKHAPNAMATEVMRVASKKVKDGVIAFNHRSVFPVLFVGDAVEKWWKAVLVFKVFAKSAGQKTPSLQGTCSIPLKTVLKSDDLSISAKLDVKDRSKPGSGSSSTSTTPQSASGGDVIGDLQVSVELASDSKDFSTALAKTKIAEMKNPKIVPIPKPKPKPQMPSIPDGPPTQATQTTPQTTNIHSMTRPPVVPRSPQYGVPQHGYLQQDAQHGFPQHGYPQHGTQQHGYPQQGAQQHSYPQLGASQYEPHQNAPQQNFQVPISYENRHQDSGESMTLHTLLLIPEGRNITLHGSLPPGHSKHAPKPTTSIGTGWSGRDMSTRNLYLVCRMFWCNDSVTSGVCWGTFEPQFNFTQVVPVLVTPALLERMRNNFMVIEVWDKKTTSQKDQLVGIVKLSLHQFFMSFRDQKISRALLKSQYPVVAVDNWFPIVDPFTGNQYGQIKVLLAMGAAEQVSALQRLKLDPGSVVAVPQRPDTYLERGHLPGVTGEWKPVEYGSRENMVEHVFELVVEGVRGLNLFQDMMWGEADCFIQYHFPAQQQTKIPGAPVIKHAVPSLKSFRSATTLCIPDPTFNEVIKHKIVLPEGTPVQRELVTACAGAGGGAGGIPFEIWCRYYYPNVRDQVIAKASLPLAKLCAMVTMQRRGEPSVQTFSLPLMHTLPDEGKKDAHEDQSKVTESGLLDVTINYRESVVKSLEESSYAGASRNLSVAQVCISVTLIRAAGLKMAASVLARHDSGMQYASEVGVNSYVRVKLSFLSREDERITRTVARSFSPEFSYHMDFPAPLLWTEADRDALSLAEILETAEVTFELWHQVPGLSSDLDGHYVYTGASDVKGRRLVTKTGDVLLGTTTIPLLALLTHKTGISGWYPVHLPNIGWGVGPDGEEDVEKDGYHGNKGLDRVGGGLEVSIKFAHHDDRDRVIHAARGVGWSPEYDVEEPWESADESSDVQNQVTIHIDQACFPVSNALIAGQQKLDKNAKCYIRYKFYNKGARCSKLIPLSISDDGYIAVKVDHRHIINTHRSSPFLWYLKEERLELQVWVSYSGKVGEKAQPRHRDKLIGSAYIDMYSLADLRRRQHRVSGMYPLFKPGTANLGGAWVRAHVTLTPVMGRSEQSESSGEEIYGELDSEGEEQYTRKPSRHARKPSKEPQVHEPALEAKSMMPLEDTFPVRLHIERAMHLQHVIDKTSSVIGPPNSYVTYQTAEQPLATHTSVFPASDSPVWDYEHDTRLTKELLQNENKNLVFKLWHKSDKAGNTPDKSSDRVIGFVSVDLAPLTSGLQQICGWYNIMDFNGQCRGQIKVSVVPQEPLTQARQSSVPTPTKPLQTSTRTGYHTTASYPDFPSHLSWYPEQQIHLDTHASLPHYEEHYNNVKKYHESLHTQHEPPRRHWQPLGVEVKHADDTSKSFLLANLRANMNDLDQITQKLKYKLASSQWPDQDRHADQSSMQDRGYTDQSRTMDTGQEKPDTGPEREDTGQYQPMDMVRGIVHQTVGDLLGSGLAPHGRVTSTGVLNQDHLGQSFTLPPGGEKRKPHSGTNLSPWRLEMEDIETERREVFPNESRTLKMSPKMADTFSQHRPDSERSESVSSRSSQGQMSPTSPRSPVRPTPNERKDNPKVVTRLDYDKKMEQNQAGDIDTQDLRSELDEHSDTDSEENTLRGWRQPTDSESDIQFNTDDEASIVIPKPLNDISAPGFGNFAPGLQNENLHGQGYMSRRTIQEENGPVRTFQEKDSWLSDSSINGNNKDIDNRIRTLHQNNEGTVDVDLDNEVAKLNKGVVEGHLQRKLSDDFVKDRPRSSSPLSNGNNAQWSGSETERQKTPDPLDKHRISHTVHYRSESPLQYRQQTPSPLDGHRVSHRRKSPVDLDAYKPLSPRSQNLRTPSPILPMPASTQLPVSTSPESDLSRSPTPLTESDINDRFDALRQTEIQSAESESSLPGFRTGDQLPRMVPTQQKPPQRKRTPPHEMQDESIKDGTRPDVSKHGASQDGSSSETEVLQFVPKENIPPQQSAPPASSDPVPNFFLPPQHLEQSMRALQMVTSGKTDMQDVTEREKEKAQAAQALVGQLSQDSSRTRPLGVKNRPLPTADEAKRIAKIFSTKFS